MPVTANLTLSASGTHTTALDRGTASFPYSASATAAFTSGVAAGQVDRVFTDDRTLAASGTENLDLAGVLTDAFGAAITFARIKSVFISAAPGNTNNVQVTRPATNGVALFIAASDGIELRPGAAFAWISGMADAIGIPVTAGTGDLLTITNSAGTTGVTYTVVITGCSA